MTPAPSAADQSQARYEALRCHAVTGATAVGRPGLVVLLREGLAAWWVWCAVGAAGVETAPPPARPAAGALVVADEGQAGIIRVLASMVLGGHPPRHPPEVNA